MFEFVFEFEFALRCFDRLFVLVLIPSVSLRFTTNVCDLSLRLSLQQGFRAETRTLGTDGYSATKHKTNCAKSVAEPISLLKHEASQDPTLHQRHCMTCQTKQALVSPRSRIERDVERLSDHLPLSMDRSSEHFWGRFSQ